MYSVSVNNGIYYINNIDRHIDRHMEILNKSLLGDKKYRLTAKSIKKIYVNGNFVVKIKKGDGLNMTVESYDLILCRIDGETLFIEPYSVYKWFCCIPMNFRSPNNKEDYSEIWNIDAIFTVNMLCCSGNGVMLMNEGFDTNLMCKKIGNGLISISGLYVASLDCCVIGNGEIRCLQSNCSNFTGNIEGKGKIITPKVKSRFNGHIFGKGCIECAKHSSCMVIEKVEKGGEIKIIDLLDTK